MADNKKYLWKAYGAAFLGLVLGLVGMHRLYLEYTVSGIMMLFILIGGIASLVYGYFWCFLRLLKVWLMRPGGGRILTTFPTSASCDNSVKESGLTSATSFVAYPYFGFWWICSVCRCWFGGRMIHTDSRY